MPKQSSHPTGGFEELKRLSIFLAKKVALVAGAWVVIFFIAQLTATGVLMLLNMLIGALAGAVIGWYMADDAVAEAGFSGTLLSIVLVMACWIPIWLTNSILATLMHMLLGWDMTFGRWMLLTFATIFSLIACVWRSAADE